MSNFTAETFRNWAYAHAYSGGAQVSVQFEDVPPFYIEKSDAVYLIGGADNANALREHGYIGKVFSGKIERPDYRYAIMRNGAGIGDVFFALKAGFAWAKQNGYPLDKLATFLQPVTYKHFKDFCFYDQGGAHDLNLVLMPQLELETAEKFFAVWAEGFDDHVIFDNTIESVYLRTYRDMRIRANRAQCNRLPEHSYLAENYRVAGVAADYPQNLILPKPEFFDFDPAQDSFAGKVVWHLRGSNVQKWYPYMNETIRLLNEKGLEVIILCAPMDDFMIKSTIAKEFWPLVRANGSLARVMAKIIKSNVRAFIGQETGISIGLGFVSEVPQVLLVSHTEPKRFSEFQNTVCLTAETPPPCWPCYQAHKDFSRCQMHAETKAAACMAAITPEQIVSAVLQLPATTKGD